VLANRAFKSLTEDVKSVSDLPQPTRKIPPHHALEIILFAFHFFQSIFNHMVEYSSRTLDRTFGALADPTRRRILARLAKGDECVTDLARPYSISLAAVSKHVIVLEKAGLVKRRRRGRVHSLRLVAVPPVLGGKSGPL